MDTSACMVREDEPGVPSTFRLSDESIGESSLSGIRAI